MLKAIVNVLFWSLYEFWVYRLKPYLKGGGENGSHL